MTGSTTLGLEAGPGNPTKVPVVTGTGWYGVLRSGLRPARACQSGLKARRRKAAICSRVTADEGQ